MAKYIITGGSGMVGKRLTEMLVQERNAVSILSRKNIPDDFCKYYTWNIDKKEIDSSWLNQTDTIIHLAGAGVADKKWTPAYKNEIYSSRINSTRLLFETLKNKPHTIKTIVASSAIGIYGNDISETVNEDSSSANTFLAKVCNDWENEVLKFETIGIRVVILRTGIVLSDKGGFIAEISTPIKFFVGGALGSGKQIMSWIHIDDLCRMYIKAAEDDQLVGVYNAVAPYPESNSAITKKIAAQLHKPLLLPNVPIKIMNFLFGEMASMILANQNVSCKKIQQAGFHFKFNDIDSALNDLIR